MKTFFPTYLFWQTNLQTWLAKEGQQRVQMIPIAHSYEWFDLFVTSLLTSLWQTNGQVLLYFSKNFCGKKMHNFSQFFLRLRCSKCPGKTTTCFFSNNIWSYKKRMYSIPETTCYMFLRSIFCVCVFIIMMFKTMFKRKYMCVCVISFLRRKKLFICPYLLLKRNNCFDDMYLCQ